MPLVDVFGDEEILELFSEHALVEAWLEVEQALALAQAELGIIPTEAAAAIAAEATGDKVDLGRLREQTRVVGYPILPLLEQIKEASSPDVARYLHWGATTQDVMDTGLALSLGPGARSGGDARAQLSATRSPRGPTSTERRSWPAARMASHAVPITFGGKVAVWLAELERHVERLRSARVRAAVVQLFGAAGTAQPSAPRSASFAAGWRHISPSRWLTSPGTPRATRLAEAGFVLAATSPRRAARSPGR